MSATAVSTVNRDSAVVPIVCLVDDDASVRKSTGRLLESAGLKVRTFGDPKTFLEYVSQNPVPVAVLDIWMEPMTGMELLAHLCARSPETRIIFITGRDDTAAETTVMQAGAFAFFIKPFDDKPFLNAVRRALETSATGADEKPLLDLRARQ